MPSTECRISTNADVWIIFKEGEIKSQKFSYLGIKPGEYKIVLANVKSDL